MNIAAAAAFLQDLYELPTPEVLRELRNDAGNLLIAVDVVLYELQQEPIELQAQDLVPVVEGA